MSAARTWWSGLSGRERRLVSVMIVLVGAMLFWLGIWRPIHAGIDTGWARYGAALDTNAAVRARLKVLRRLPARSGGAAAELGQSVAQSAAEAGLTLDRSAGQGRGRFSLTIGSARAGALLAWLAGLEARGIMVETISMTPGTTPGTVVAQAVLRGTD
jgi:general secretion pathway protein M